MRKLLLLILSMTLWVYPQSDRLAGHVRFLASDPLQGRENGSLELELAAEYLEGQFRSIGLMPLGDAGSFSQRFEVQRPQYFGPTNRLTFFNGSVQQRFDMGLDYVPLSFGGGAIRGDIVFADVGSMLLLSGDLVAELEGKVLVLRDGGAFRATGLVGPSRLREIDFSMFMNILRAREAGSEAVVFLSSESGGSQDGISFTRDLQIENLGIPAVWLRREASSLLLDFIAAQQQGSKRLRDRRLDLEVELSVDVVSETQELRNLVGYLPGETDEVLVLGAHYDHLGVGGRASADPRQVGQIHNGADDNASGTALLLELSRRFAEIPRKRGIIFVAFAGEEIGLLGSRFYVENPPYPLGLVTAMFNFDMVGRAGGEVAIAGLATGAGFEEILQRVQAESVLRLNLFQSPSASSDHLSFFNLGIPVLFFSTGQHTDYHRSTDDFEAIDLKGLAEILEVGFLAAREIVDSGERIQPEFFNELLLRADSSRTGLRRLGLSADPYWTLEGIRVARTHQAGAASGGVVQAGDIILEANGALVVDAANFEAILSEVPLGGQLELLLIREGRLLKLELVLT